MSEYCPEQHPLLCDEVSEEKYSPRYYHRGPMTYRTRQNLKGAAAILTRWPDHWSSLLSYWWIGLGMISITTFIIYNGLFAFSMLPSASQKTPHPIFGNLIEKETVKIPLVHDVFMHVFVEESKELNVKDYMPYIETVSHKYENFIYHLIVVINDTNVDSLSPNENNELALDLLWTKDKTAFKQETSTNKNIRVQHITLSTYMDNSPLIKIWRLLPPQLIEFLARAISIWDKGGVAFNPNILRDRLQNSLYIEKLNNLLNKYSNLTKTTDTEIIYPTPKSIKKAMKPTILKKERKFNNIRDIINALENEGDSVNNLSHQSLIEAEDIISPTIVSNEHNTTSKTSKILKNIFQEETEVNHNHRLTSSGPKDLSFRNSNESENQMSAFDNNSSIHSNNNFNKTRHSLLPLFLEFLFHNKETNKSNSKEIVKTRKRKDVVQSPKSEKYTKSSKKPMEKWDKKFKNDLEPVIVPAPKIYDNFKSGIELHNKESKEIIELNQLSIDLKGNIIATDTACHAFLGTIFSNVVHHRGEETVTDFIISELTIFCKGLLSSCMGINLILL